MDFKKYKENLESISKIIALSLAISYGAGFLLWNWHLSSYGYFEYDLLQTRFIFSGIVAIMFFAPVVWFIKKILETKFISKSKDFTKFIICIFILFLTLFLLSRIIFPWIPQHLGGARPFPKSIIGEPDEIEFLSNFNIPSAKNADGKSSVQTNLVCEIYNNRDLIIIGTIGETGSTLRILNIRKDKIKGFQSIAIFEEEKYRKIVCAKFFYGRYLSYLKERFFIYASQNIKI